MAAGNFTVINAAFEKILNGVFNLEGGNFVLVLTTSGQALAADFVGTSGSALYSDLTAEVSNVGTGYTSGGKDMTGVSVSLAGGVATVNADQVVWPGTSLTAKYVVMCRADETGDPTDILGFFDTETTEPDGRTSSGDLVVNFINGLFTLDRD